MSGKNAFGGGNKNSLYVPMSEIEQEALQRIIATGDCWVKIVDWGTLRNPPMTFGDSRLSIPLRMNFNRPEVPQPNWGFNLELWWGSTLLFQEWQKTVMNGEPIKIAAGFVLEMEWLVQIARIDPQIVKAIMPGALGLTSRRTDKATGDATDSGNMDLSSKQRGLMRTLLEGEAAAKQFDREQQVKVAALKKKALGGQ